MKASQEEIDGSVVFLRVTSTTADERNGLNLPQFSLQIDCLLHTNIKWQNGQAEFPELHWIRTRTLLFS